MLAAEKHHELYGELTSIVGSKYVSDSNAVLLSYTRDISSFPPGRPQGVVVRPNSVEEVVELVRLANQTRTPLVPMGGKASLSGVPPGQPGRGIIVDMKRMDKVIEIDETNMAVTAQAGISMGELAGKVRKRGFDIHTAAQPHYNDTLGGQISGEPAAGFGEYGYSVGWNWHYLLGMKVVLPNASIIDTGTGEGSISSYQGHTWARGMQGPDLTGIFIGDAGIFGIKVEATYRMFHLPKFRRSSARCWDTLEEAYAAYHELWEIDPYMYMQPYASGIIINLELISMIDPAGETKWIFSWISVGNSEEEVELKHKTTENICIKHGGKVASPDILAFTEEFNTFVQHMNKWASMGLEVLFELVVSRRDVVESLNWTREYLFGALRDKGIDPSSLQILSALWSAGTGNGMTSTIPLMDQRDPHIAGVIHEIWLEFLEQARRRGYVLEATQGHEAKLKAKQWTPQYYNFVLNLKKYMDPNNIMNPGLFFP